eukprot:5666609-Pleurochrysis_carterae.AAC.2
MAASMAAMTPLSLPSSAPAGRSPSSDPAGGVACAPGVCSAACSAVRLSPARGVSAALSSVAMSKLIARAPPASRARSSRSAPHSAVTRRISSNSGDSGVGRPVGAVLTALSGAAGRVPPAPAGARVAAAAVVVAAGAAAAAMSAPPASSSCALAANASDAKEPRAAGPARTPVAARMAPLSSITSIAPSAPRASSASRSAATHDRPASATR